TRMPTCVVVTRLTGLGSSLSASTWAAADGLRFRAWLRAVRAILDRSTATALGPLHAWLQLERGSRDVAPESHAVEGDTPDRLVCAPPRAGGWGRGPGHGEDASAVRDEAALEDGSAAVEDKRTPRLRVTDTIDREAGVVAPRRVVGAGEDDGHGGI